MSDPRRPDAGPLLDLSSHPSVRALLAAEVAHRDRLSLRVAAEDEMLLFSLATRDGDFDLAAGEYAQSGARIVASLRQLMRWRFGGFEKIGHYLDFASGWGRVTRFLLTEVPRERLWIADIVPSAVSFQQRELGVHGLLSAPDPAAFATETRFDCIVVTSLFTHLPERTFRAWLERLTSLLAPGGMLVLSAHDTSLLPPEWVLPPGGLFFLPLSESQSLDKQEYGSTWVEEAFVTAAVADTARALGTPLSLHRLARGYCNFHDLYLVVREEGVDFSGLVFERDPEGFLDFVTELADGSLRFTGWCAYPEALQGIAASGIARVELVVDGEVVAATEQLSERPDVDAERPGYRQSGFELVWRLPPLASATTTAIVLRGITRRGHSTVLYVGTVAMALLQAKRTELALAARQREELAATLAVERERLGEAREEVAHLTAQVDRLHAELDAARAVATRHGATIDHLERRLAAIEASRFWALRERWWRLKTAAGGGPDPLATRR
jgi:hypothetical protein